MDKKKFLCPAVLFLPFILLILANTTSVNAANVSIQWDANTPSPEGYKVFSRLDNLEYDYENPTWQGSSNSCVINNLESGSTYCFVVRAYDGSLESIDSDEVTVTVADDTSSETDTTPPSWSGATNGIGAVESNGSSGSVTIEFDTATDAIDGNNLNYNVYYAPTQSWNQSDWTQNSTITSISTSTGSFFTYAVSVNNLTNDVSYTIGVRAEDQSGNEDTNTSTMTVIPTVSTDLASDSNTNTKSQVRGRYVSQ
ncbi:fibronectin type III domain protein [Desulfosarcina variabilis str. Montpellier]|uniref:fibronectin type III domain-containing protein n=1 Tax=Desulfosarcina variabilis TaxID=2300 RepID=UPI003AFA4CFB